MDLSEVLLEPLLTEKTVREQEINNAYTFIVHPDANKIEVRQAIEHQFDVEVDDVRTMNVKGKPRRVRGIPGYTSNWKKAVVRLPEDEHIEAVEGLVG
jgi:large subunit ribosomal protein L23